MLEPYAVKVARTVLRGGKPERAYLSQLDTLVVHTLNDGGYRLGHPCELREGRVSSHPRSEGIKLPAWEV